MLCEVEMGVPEAGRRTPDAPKGQRVGRLVSGARNSKAREIS